MISKRLLIIPAITGFVICLLAFLESKYRRAKKQDNYFIMSTGLVLRILCLLPAFEFVGVTLIVFWHLLFNTPQLTISIIVSVLFLLIFFVLSLVFTLHAIAVFSYSITYDEEGLRFKNSKKSDKWVSVMWCNVKNIDINYGDIIVYSSIGKHKIPMGYTGRTNFIQFVRKYYPGLVEDYSELMELIKRNSNSSN